MGKSCSFDFPCVSFVKVYQFVCLLLSPLVLRVGCGIWLYYSKTSVARTLMARLPWLIWNSAYVDSLSGFELVLESLGKNPIATDYEQFKVIFHVILKLVYCVYSLESPQ